MLRKPAVAGMFYPDDSEELVKTIEDCFLHSFGPGKIPDIESFEGNDYPVNVMVPHAGFQYSGTIAAHSYCELAKNGFPEVFIIIGPNHTGLGSEVSVFNKGEWITPLGNIQVDEEFADKISKKVNGASGEIIDINSVKKKKYSPALYDLTELQRDANKIFGYSAKQTLNIMQRLYENHKILTYPRTDSRYITTDIVATLPDRLKAISISA